MADRVRENLERLVFEVYGAEEGQRKIDALIKKEKEHAKSMKGLAKQAKASAKTEEDAAKRVEAAQKKRSEATAKTLKSAGLGLVALAALAAEASATMEAAQGKVERSFKKMGVGGAELDRSLAKVDARSRTLGLGLAEQREHLANLIEVSGSATQATRDLALANDIAATGDADRAQAVKALAQAYKGEVSELINLDGFTKESIEQLNEIEDQNERAAEAVRVLTKAYGGAAEQLKGTTNSFENLKQAGTDLLVVFGDVGSGLINKTAEWFGVIGENQSLLDQFAGGLRNLASEAGELEEELDPILDQVGALALAFSKGGAGGVGAELATGQSLADRISEFRNKQAREAAQPVPDTAESETAGPRRGKFKGAREELRLRELESEREHLEALENEQKERQRAQDAAAKEAAAERARQEAEAEAMRQQLAADGLEFFRQREKDKTAALIEEINARTEAENQSASFLDETIKATARIKREDGEATEKIEADKKEANKKTIGAVKDSAFAGAAAAASLIKDEKAKALISGGLETAKSISDFASFNFPGGIGHAAAAVQYFAVAGSSGGAKSKSGGGAAPGGGASGGARAPSSGPAQQDRLDLVGRGPDSFGSAKSVVVNINSAFPPTPEQGAQLANAVMRDSDRTAN